MVGDTRQGWAVLAAMTILFVGLLAVAYVNEQNGNPALTALGVDQAASATQSGGNMEGKEVRFGIANSALWATATTSASNGSVNAMHDSFTPLGGLVPMWLMQLGEVVFGGVGSGLYGMLVFAIIAVFIAGLMIGRTPEYLGKKIEAFDVKMASIVILVPPLLVLVGTAVGVMADAGKAGILNPGAARFLGDPVRLLLRQQQQRQRLRRTLGQHALLQLGARARDVLRALLAGGPDTRHRGLAGGQETHPERAGDDADAHAALRRAPDRHRAARRRPDVHPGAGARARGGAPDDVGRTVNRAALRRIS